MTRYITLKKKNLFKVSNLMSMMIYIIYMPGCTGNNENKKDDQKKSAAYAVTISKPSSSYADTLIIASASAVFYMPDSLQLERIRSVNTKNIFESMQHDCFYQMRNARQVLKKYWPQVRIIETSKARYLLFVRNDKNKIGIDLNTKNDMCGIFLFKKEKEPELIDMMNIDTDLEFYFKN